MEQIPEIYFTKLTELAFLLSGTEKFDAAKKQKWISFEQMLQMMIKIAECYVEEGNQSAADAELTRGMKLLDTLEENNQVNNAFSIYRNYFYKHLKMK